MRGEGSAEQEEACGKQQSAQRVGRLQRDVAAGEGESRRAGDKELGGGPSEPSSLNADLWEQPEVEPDV